MIRTFAAGYITRTSWSLISNIVQLKFRRLSTDHLSKRSLSRFLRSVYLDTNSLRFALGLTVLSFSYKFCLCFLFRRMMTRWTADDDDGDRYQRRQCLWAAVSGFIAGFLALNLIESKSTRKTVALFCIVRSIGDCLRVLGKLRRWRLSSWSKTVGPLSIDAESAVFVVVQIPIMFSFMHSPSLMERRYFESE